MKLSDCALIGVYVVIRLNKFFLLQLTQCNTNAVVKKDQTDGTGSVALLCDYSARSYSLCQ